MIEFQNRLIKMPDGSPVIVCRIKGSIDGSTLLPFEEKLLGFLEQGVKHLIVVFSEVHYINSTGMGVLVKLADKFREVGGDINLVDVPDKLVALFNMLGLLALIKLSKTEQEALNNFQKNKETASKEQMPAAPPAPAPLPPPPPVTTSAEKLAAQRTEKSPMQPMAQRTAPSPAPAPARKKVYVIKCKKCGAKVSLGSRLRVGAYKCPHCMAVFRLSKTGKIEYIS